MPDAGAPSADFLVAGAGPAGSTIARLLATLGHRVSLVDPLRLGHGRLEVLSPAVLPIMDALKLTHLLDDKAIARPCLGIRRQWQSSQTQVDDFIRHPGGRGFVIDRRPFDEALRNAALGAGVKFGVGRVVAVKAQRNAMLAAVVHGARQSQMRARFVIDATGRPALLARRLGARRLVCERLIAELSEISPPDGDSRGAVWLDAVTEGNAWSYSVSGPDGRTEKWKVWRRGVGRPHRLASVASDASSAHLSRAGGVGWMAVGDAAAAFDPICSQGLGHALSTSLVATGAIGTRGRSYSEACREYSEAIFATFAHSEFGRRLLYGTDSPKNDVHII